mmetsp:Transcript_40382/g.95975  ORF Transcript_40382/g.95975 Transcript_40382/m.95975 type:complete len:407 (-) Transcript_40382:148-1368(-)|eukprot:CAMPEP_0177714112 /NCGR_PEP_ID=MMETSP0484_2-20121128/13291_1 /TAXON_ID=354590 /ORGANISM="Rhodomonas lens, Strain RHODO" /LENGTH=406 /DNA_ID=CAMNT_0019226031 /DNA_START=101 /DNA_END=1321 /DNA_ORIENTATION=-
MPPKAPVKGKPKAVAKKDGAKPDPRDPQGIFSAQFDFLDANGDGMIDTKEFRHGLISAGWSQDELSDLFDKIDVSHDGKISREEYLNYHAKKESKAMSLDPKKVFEEMDQDKDQALNLRELAKLIRKVENEEGFLGDLDFSGYCKEQLAAADTDKDGKLNFAEFVPWFKGFIHHVESIRDKFEQELLERKQARDQAPAPAAPNPSRFSGDGVWDCPLPAVVGALEAAWAKKKIPLLIDDTMEDRETLDPSPLELFFQYGGYTLLEMKRMVVEVNMQKVKPLDTAMEEARQKLVRAIKFGNVLCVLLANSVPPIKSKFNADDTLPLAIFDGNLVSAVVGAVVGSSQIEGSWVEKVIRKADDCAMVRDKFNVLVVTKFRREDYEDFLKEDVPLDHMQHIHVHKVKKAD